ncbi:MAG TPA: lysylphosphatidylglycerol synthase transmembrane domain-containing protein [Smithellaceae bacterium]|nr:lysylphosphatidylglycerol synthase transmembrane domain-containing protein [Smithellaceae bacterium]HOM68817.1 lysylphosphatidylglycerol synthase transmembrane domain-containing protein [Smithellaceae bacterium]HOS10053.1 lysylphosphatidylglycerol synthase transmembrane domain-containing protein [Smithellaceae bacterium]HOU05080.1 lysylphosphatidylglycerol synthase transmembrane domain-containing protein [Smithellaceae bacterium]HPD50065.1 lysylphosphatidylglycerol synthase transmembrane dom
MNKKIIIGILLSLILVYLSIRGVDINNALNNLKKIKPSFIAAFIAAILIMQFLRSYRWGVILSPLQKIDQLSLFSVTSVGFLAVVGIPARLGELARPYLIAQKNNINFSSAFGTIIIERVLDGFTVISIIIIALSFMDLPIWVMRSSILFFLLMFIFFLFIIILIWRRKNAINIINRILSKLPGKMANKFDKIIHNFIDGFVIITDLKMLFYLIFLSAIIWLIDVMAIHIMLLAFGFTLPFIAPFVLMIILIAGIAVPTAPGFIGNWHIACILGLSIFGVQKPEALSFAVVYHFLSIFLIVALGVIFLPFNKFSFSDIKKQFNKANTNT